MSGRWRKPPSHDSPRGAIGWSGSSLRPGGEPGLRKGGGAEEVDSVVSGCGAETLPVGGLLPEGACSYAGGDLTGFAIDGEGGVTKSCLVKKSKPSLLTLLSSCAGLGERDEGDEWAIFWGT